MEEMRLRLTTCTHASEEMRLRSDETARQVHLFDQFTPDAACQCDPGLSIRLICTRCCFTTTYTGHRLAARGRGRAARTARGLRQGGG